MEPGQRQRSSLDGVWGTQSLSTRSQWNRDRGSAGFITVVTDIPTVQTVLPENHMAAAENQDEYDFPWTCHSPERS